MVEEKGTLIIAREKKRNMQYNEFPYIHNEGDIINSKSVSILLVKILDRDIETTREK